MDKINSKINWTPSPQSISNWNWNNILKKIDSCLSDLNNNNNELKILLIKHFTWDYCKVFIKEKSLFYAKVQAKDIKNTLVKLENNLKTLIEFSNNNERNKQLDKEIIFRETKEIESIYSFKATGPQVRARIEILENDEKQSKLFLGLENLRQTRKVMHNLNINGQEITGIKEILKYEVQFYKICIPLIT